MILATCLSLVACDDPVTEQVRKYQARSGLDAALAELPRSADFQVIKTDAEEYVDPEWGLSPDHYLARGHTVFGSSLPKVEAVNAYFRAVQSLGWKPDPERDQYEDSRSLTRGPNQLLVISVGYPDGVIIKAHEYDEAKGKYKGVIVVSVDYTLP